MIIKAYKEALKVALKTVEEVSQPVDISNNDQMLKLVRSCLGTKFVSRWGDLMCNLAIDAVRCVAMEQEGKQEVDIKRYARIEKVFSFFF